jgi:hypothetical protein
MDWLVAFDDGLTLRLRCCTLCGRTPVHLWGVCGSPRAAFAYVLCRSCHDTGGVRRVEVLFAQRYEAGA